MTEEKLTFIGHLTLALKTFDDECIWLTSDIVAEMVNAAAHAVAEETDMEMSIAKMVSSDGLRTMHMLFIGPSKDDWVLLYSDDLAYLRAMLCNYDETEPPRVGDALTVNVREEHGCITTRVTQEMLDANLTEKLKRKPNLVE